MRKIFTTLALAAAALTSVPASAVDLGLFNHLGVDVSVGTTGIGVEVATPISKWVAARGGVHIMPNFGFNTTLDGTTNVTINGVQHEEYYTMDTRADLHRVQGSLIFNAYPFPDKSSFYVAAGAYFGGSQMLRIKGHSDELRQKLAEAGKYNSSFVEIGDYELPVDKNGDVNGSLRVKGFRPYVGLGFGRPVPKRRVNFGFELGVQFAGKMKLYSGKEELRLDKLIDSDDDWQKWIDKLTVYPVLKFTLSGRIF